MRSHTVGDDDDNLILERKKVVKVLEKLRNRKPKIWIRTYNLFHCKKIYFNSINGRSEKSNTILVLNTPIWLDEHEPIRKNWRQSTIIISTN